MKKQLLLILSLVIFLFLIIIPMASAIYKVDIPLEFTAGCDKINCSLGWNITVLNPNSTILVNNEAMDVGDYYANYSFTPSEEGTYLVYLTDTEGNESYSTSVTVNYSGYDLTEGKSILYSLIWIASLLLILGLQAIGIYLPGGNQTDEMTGYILAVSNLKYLKLTCLGLAWVFGVFLSYLTWMLSYAYLNMNFVSTIMQTIFYIMAYLTLPLFIFFVYLTIANLVRDSKIADALLGGLQTDG